MSVTPMTLSVCVVQNKGSKKWLVAVEIENKYLVLDSSQARVLAGELIDKAAEAEVDNGSGSLSS